MTDATGAGREGAPPAPGGAGGRGDRGEREPRGGGREGGGSGLRPRGGARRQLIRAGAYLDSVVLLELQRRLSAEPGVLRVAAVMATPANQEVLAEASLGNDETSAARPDDLVVVVEAVDDAGAAAALSRVDELLTQRRQVAATDARPRSLESALRLLPSAHWVLVSVPGAYAAEVAWSALGAGRHVFLFSDHVPLAEEVALKRAARQRGLLVLGPDCGTAVIAGTGLGFANRVKLGPVGIVAASGTGCQQLLALLDHAGVGVSNALGVGGRDLSAAVGGRSTREALRRLDADPAVELIVLVSKPPADDVATDIREFAAALDTPVEIALLGPGQPDLTAAAERVLQRLGHAVPEWPVTGLDRLDHREGKLDHREGKLDHPEGKLDHREQANRKGDLLQGLFVGGTLRDEAALIAGGEHPMVDFGADELTQGRAHPMIDPAIRLEHLSRVADDPRTGAVLLDVVLGHGAEPDPAAALAPVVRDVVTNGVPVVVSCVGTTGDPQGLDAQRAALAEAGAEVHLSNARATRRALELLGRTS